MDEAITKLNKIMEHTILIWSKRKNISKGVLNVSLIETRIKLSQSEIEEIALKQYIFNHGISEDREYWAELEETKHK